MVVKAPPTNSCSRYRTCVECDSVSMVDGVVLATSLGVPATGMCSVYSGMDVMSCFGWCHCRPVWGVVPGLSEVREVPLSSLLNVRSCLHEVASPFSFPVGVTACRKKGLATSLGDLFVSASTGAPPLPLDLAPPPTQGVHHVDHHFIQKDRDQHTVLAPHTRVRPGRGPTHWAIPCGPCS